MKKLFSNYGTFPKKAMIVGAALAVVVTMSYFSIGNDPDHSLDMLMASCCTGRMCAEAGCNPCTNCKGVTVPCGGGDGCECTNYCDFWQGTKACNNCPFPCPPGCKFN